MLMVIVLVVLGIAFFVGGVIFIIKGVRDDGGEEVSAVVPISDMQEIKSINNLESKETVSLEKKTFDQRIEEPAPLPVEPAAEVTARNDKAAENSAELERVKNELAQLKESSEKQIAAMTAENGRLNEALNRELSSRDEKTLSDDEREQLVWKENKLKEAQGALERLTKENHGLTALVDETKLKNDQLLREMSTARDAMERDKQDLIEKLELSQKEKDSFEEVIARLKQEIEQVRNQHDTRINESIDKLKIENGDLKTENVKYADMIKDLQDDLELVKIKNEQKLRESETMIAQLKIKVSEAERQLETKSTKELDILRQEIVKFKYENEQFVKNNAQLQADFQQAKEFNERLLEKESLLHYELTKSRAQVLGLEKICTDFKIQLEEMDSARV